MTGRYLSTAVLILISAFQNLEASPKESEEPVSLRIVPEETILRGLRASQRFLTLATYSDGMEREVTAQAHFSISDPKVAQLAPGPRLVSLADGAVTLKTRLGDLEATAAVRMEESGQQNLARFDRDIARILTKRGCNSSSCHGGVKGRGGFKLSSDAANPRADYEWITRGGGYQVLIDQPLEPRIPRVDLKDPENSLLLQKPTGRQLHGGGLRLPSDSPDYQEILHWIQSGARYGRRNSHDPRRQQLQVFPEEAVLDPHGAHQLLVTAHYSDGTREDVTDQVRYESLDPEILKVSATGRVQANGPGEAVVMIRSAGRTANARFGVVLRPIPNYPPVRTHNFIDDQIFDKLKRFHIIPSPLSDDAEFLRRVCLDVTGTLPPPERVREFLTDPNPRKREELVEILLDSPEYVEYWTFRFADLFRVRLPASSYWEWIRKSLAGNKPYDVMARERISAQGASGAAKHFIRPGVGVDQVVAEQFRVFFGRRMDCAQCHDHPYDSWTQDQFWGLAAFFGRTTNVGNGRDEVVYEEPLGLEENFGEMGRTQLHFKPVTHPRTGRQVEPAFLNGQTLAQQTGKGLRTELAHWMTSHPAFAEATVNRFWGHFFARGLIDPVDDFRLGNPPSHPGLLKKLAADFREHGYDLKHLIRRIVLSRTYQLSSRTNESNAQDRLNYSHARPRPLPAEVLLDAISSATGVMEDFQPPGGVYAYETAPPGTRAINLKYPSSYHSRFLEIYGRPQRNTVGERETRASLSQALHMLVGSTYTDKLSHQGGCLDRLLEKGASNREIMEELYLATLSRFPSPVETQRLSALLASQPDRRGALEDLLWALISSREFADNH